MKNIGFQKWKTISIYAVCVIIMSVVYAAYYRNVRQQALSDVQSCVKGMLYQEMQTRGRLVQAKMKIRNWRKGEVFRPYPFTVTMNVGKGKETFLMDSLSSMKNIASTSQERVLHSTSLVEVPFRLDSFRMACIDSLAQRGLFVRLFFDFRDRKEHTTSGDSLSSLPVIDYNLGYGNEYTLKAYAHIPFLFSWNVGIGLGIVVLMIATGGVYGYRRKHKSEPEATQEALHEETSVDTNKVCYVREHRTFHLPNSEHTVQLTKREAEIFEALYFAPEHTMLSADLRQKIIGDTTIQTSALATRLIDIRKKLKEVGDFSIEYNRATNCYVLLLPSEGMEMTDVYNFTCKCTNLHVTA